MAQGSEDKRLEIDLESLRESLWEYADDTPKDEITEMQYDKVRWIDTSTMLCDPLTKSGPAHFPLRPRKAMTTGILDLEAAPESILWKMQQQRSRLNKIS